MIVKPDEFTNCLIGGYGGRFQRAMHQLHMVIEAVSMSLCFYRMPIHVIHRGLTQVDRTLQFFQYRTFIGFVTVQFETDIAEPSAVQATFHHVQRSHLLCHKQHGPPVFDSRRYHIGDRLRLACPRRALHNQIASAPHLLDNNGL